MNKPVSFQTVTAGQIDFTRPRTYNLPMLRHLIRWLITSLVILAVPHLVSGIQVDTVGAALAVALVLGFLNTLVRPILIILTLPLTVLTLGLFLLVINALLLQLAAFFVAGVHIASFGSAFWGALLISLVSWALHLSGKDQDGRRVIVIEKRWDRPPRRTIDLN